MTDLRSKPPWVNRLTGKAVAWHDDRAGIGPAESIELLQMLGVIDDGQPVVRGPDGRRPVLPDDTRSYDDITGAQFGVGDNNLDVPVEKRAAPPGEALLADRSLLPPGLRDKLPAQTTPKKRTRPREKAGELPPVRDLPPTRPARKKPAPAKRAEPAAKWRAGQRRANTPVCGTPQGYDRHRRLAKADPTHKACQPCKAAAAKRQADYRDGRSARATPAPAQPRPAPVPALPASTPAASPAPPPVAHLPAPRPTVPEHAALLQGTGELHRWAATAQQTPSLAIRGAGRRLDDALRELYAAVTHLARTEQVAGVRPATGAQP